MSGNCGEAHLARHFRGMSARGSRTGRDWISRADKEPDLLKERLQSFPSSASPEGRLDLPSPTMPRPADVVLWRASKTNILHPAVRVPQPSPVQS